MMNASIPPRVLAFSFLNKKGKIMSLFEYRAKKRLTQWDVRKATGIHQSKISLIENGYVNPSEDEKIKIATALGVNVKEIFPHSIGSDQE
jgi:DNA-binding XRE family transcriptional regulator